MLKLCKVCITGTLKKVTDWLFEYADIYGNQVMPENVVKYIRP